MTVRATLTRGAEPGDHRALLLLTTRAVRGRHVPVRLRLGVRVTVRMPGRVVRNVTLGTLRGHRPRHGARFMSVAVVNRGNVSVQLRGHATASLFRHHRQLARLRVAARPFLLPGARARLVLRYAGRVRGPVTAVVRVRIGSGLLLVERRYRVRL